MHVKFLVPEIDRKKWSEDFKRYVDTRGFTINDLSNISAEPNSAQIINKIKLIIEVLDDLKYNVNIPMEFDKFILRQEEL